VQDFAIFGKRWKCAGRDPSRTARRTSSRSNVAWAADPEWMPARGYYSGRDVGPPQPPDSALLPLETFATLSRLSTARDGWNSQWRKNKQTKKSRLTIRPLRSPLTRGRPGRLRSARNLTRSPSSFRNQHTQRFRAGPNIHGPTRYLSFFAKKAAAPGEKIKDNDKSIFSLPREAVTEDGFGEIHDHTGLVNCKIDPMHAGRALAWTQCEKIVEPRFVLPVNSTEPKWMV